MGATTGKLVALEEGSALITVNDTRSPGHQQSCNVRAVLRPSLVKLLLVWVKEDGAQGGLLSGAEPLDSTSVTTFHMVAGREYAIIARAYHSSYMAAAIIVSQVMPFSLSSSLPWVEPLLAPSCFQLSQHILSSSSVTASVLCLSHHATHHGTPT